jgi:hypothetical protein
MFDQKQQNAIGRAEEQHADQGGDELWNQIGTEKWQETTVDVHYTMVDQDYECVESRRLRLHTHSHHSLLIPHYFFGEHCERQICGSCCCAAGTESSAHFRKPSCATLLGLRIVSNCRAAHTIRSGVTADWINSGTACAFCVRLGMPMNGTRTNQARQGVGDWSHTIHNHHWGVLRARFLALLCQKPLMPDPQRARYCGVALDDMDRLLADLALQAAPHNVEATARTN